jgi:putative tricarboxylic transport membrane protein
MDTIASLLGGFSAVLLPQNIFFCFIGAVLGTVVGILPGLGPTAAVALLLPVTMNMDMVTGIIMLAGIYYGAMYGGSTTSILVNIPGEASSVITCIDGYKMAKQGRAGPALGIAALGSFVGGTLAIIAVMLLSPEIAEAAVKFGPPERFALLFLAFSLIGYLAGNSLARGLLMGVVGLFLGVVGTDPISGIDRFTFGTLYLRDGIDLIPVAVGVFGLGEILYNIEQREPQTSAMKTPKNLLPTRADWRASLGPIGRGSLLGFGIGVMPGGMASTASMISYAVEKRIAKDPSRFGNGAIEGVAGPETTNNAAAIGGFVPLLTLGIPTNPVLALLLSAFVLHGVTPGPLMILQHPDVFWGVIASMYVGSVMLLVLNLPLIGLFIQILRVPYHILSPLIIMFIMIGAYAINSSVADVLMTGLFGIVGYLLKRYNFEPAPLVLAMVLGRMLEESFRQTLIMSDTGSITILFSRPLSSLILLLAIIILLLPAIRWLVRALLRKGPPKDVGDEVAKPSSGTQA